MSGIYKVSFCLCSNDVFNNSKSEGNVYVKASSLELAMKQGQSLLGMDLFFSFIAVRHNSKDIEIHNHINELLENKEFMKEYNLLNNKISEIEQSFQERSSNRFISAKNEIERDNITIETYESMNKEIENLKKSFYLENNNSKVLESIISLISSQYMMCKKIELNKISIIQY